MTRPRRITARDAAMARWTARWQPVTAMQIARRFAINRRVAYRRVRALCDYDYLVSARPLNELAGTLSVTPRGERLTHTAAVHRRLEPHALWAHLAAVDAAIDLERQGRTVYSRAELTSQPVLQERLPRDDGQPLLPGALAIEPDLAIYSAVAPYGQLDDEAASLLAALDRVSLPAGLTVEILVARGAEPALPTELSARPLQARLQAIDAQAIGREHAGAGPASA